MTERVLVDITEASDGGRTVVCIPHAGAGAGAFSWWRPLLEPGMGLTVVRLPGREELCFDEPLATMDEITAAIAPELADDRYREMVLYGHCTGGLMAFELAHALVRLGRPPPRALVVSSTAVPHVMADAPRMHLFAEADLKAYIFAFAGDELAGMLDELWDMVEPAVRADLHAAELASYTTEPVDVPIVAIHGIDDHLISRSLAEDWAQYTRSTFTLTELPCGHALIDKCAEQLARTVITIAASS